MRFRDLHRTIQIRLVEQFFIGLVNNMVFPFMVIYFSGIFGASVTGIVFGCNVVLGFLAGLYGGHLSDRIGRRKIMLRMEYIRLFANVIMAAAASSWLHAPLLMLLMMSVNTICMSVSRPAGQAMVVDASTPENRTFVYRLDYWFWNGSILIGGISGGYLFATHRFELLCVVALFSVVSVNLLHFFIKETITPSQSTSPDGKKHVFRELVQKYRVAAVDKRFMLYLLMVLVQLSFEFQTRNYSAVRLANEVHPQPLLAWGHYSFMIDGYKLFALLNTLNTVLVVALGVFIGRWTKQLSQRAQQFAGLFLCTLGYAFITWNNHPWPLLLMM
ncbi:MAG: MFS transporter, partial [Tumebacillaceae bacterium]